MRSHEARPSWVVAILLWSSVARADEIVSAEQAGMGGTAVADPRDNTGILLNPATVAMVPRYDIQGIFLGGPTGDLRWAGSVIDGRTSKVLSYGFAYNGGLISSTFHPSELPGWAPVSEEPLVKKLELHEFTFALAAPFLQRRLSVGVNGTLSLLSGDWVTSKVTGNLDLGVATKPIPFFSAGLVGRDILPIAGQADMPAKILLGLRGGKEDLFEGALDVGFQAEEVVRSPWTVAAGVEGGIKFIRLRGGYDWNPERDTAHRVSWGLAVASKVGSIDYAMRLPVGKPDFDFVDVTHVLSLTLRTNFGDKKNEEKPIEWQSDDRRLFDQPKRARPLNP